ncbi:MAG: hypothetical protein IPN43_12400 [Chitinophagaceae bacterium]|nr:hypothetical protein [Chitinophagaceae bacterium]
MPLKAMMAKNQKNTNILAYAVKSDDSRKTKKNQYPAYALKSDDGENEEH